MIATVFSRLSGRRAALPRPRGPASVATRPIPAFHRLAVPAALALGLAACAVAPPAPVVTPGRATTAPSPPSPPPAPTPITAPSGASITPILPPPAVSAKPLPPSPAAAPSTPTAPVDTAPLEREARAQVLRLLPAGLADRNGWAGDIATALVALRLPPSPANICATLAVIEQESGFQGDPQVPGLNKIAWKEIEARRSRYGIPKLVLSAALAKTSPDGRSYKARIDALKTERQMNELFSDMIAELPAGRTLLADYNPVRTGGPMQVSVEFAKAQVREKPYPYGRFGMDVRREVFTRRGGVYFGMAILLDYPTAYPQALYRFADFNAGRYSSRNAAFQAAVARLAGKPLDLDGDLLRYEKGQPSAVPSATRSALVAQARRLGFNAAAIDRDLALEKTAAFAQTPLYQRVFALAEQDGRPLPREVLPHIDLKSPKIQRKLTTEWFARRVDGRYQQCMARSQA